MKKLLTVLFCSMLFLSSTVSIAAEGEEVSDDNNETAAEVIEETDPEETEAGSVPQDEQTIEEEPVPAEEPESEPD